MVDEVSEDDEPDAQDQQVEDDQVGVTFHQDPQQEG